MNFKCFLSFASVVIFSSCKMNDAGEDNTTQPAPTIAEQKTVAPEEDVTVAEVDTAVSQVDSFKIYCAEMMEAPVNLPPVYQHEIFEENEEATGKFSKLSKTLNGRMKVLVNSSAVVSELTTTIKSATAEQSDVVILFDRTGSMYSHVDKVKEGVNQIIDTIRKRKGVRLAIATYGDKNYDGPQWFKFEGFGTDYAAAAQYVKNIKIDGGGDWPESVYDAVMSCLKSDFWQSTKKCSIILVGDAPPQEKPSSDYTLEDVIKTSKERKVRMNFYPILILPEIRQVRIAREDKEKYQQISGNTRLYPNPCKGAVTLAMENTSTYYIEIYNMDGEIVANDEHFGIYWKKDLSHLPNGVYIARVINSDHTFELFRFILEH